MAPPSSRPLAEASAFATAFGIYWLEVFPQVKRELARWRVRARQIDDQRLARLALETQALERGNLEGAAVFALLAPRRRRAEVVRAAVAFQALYDLLDTLAELPVADPAANGRALHLALLAALEPGVEGCGGYLRHSGLHAAGEGFLEELIAACRGALGVLPGFCHVAAPAREAAARMVDYQSLNHLAGSPGAASMRRWGSSIAPPGGGLRWWEAAAAAASSLGVFALLAAAASPDLDARGAAATADAYFPWAGALHVLLDSLVDLERDRLSGEHSLVSHYGCAAETAERLGGVAREAAGRLHALGPGHGLILSAMAAFYLSRPAATGVHARPAAERVIAELGTWTIPAITILQARSLACGASRKSSSGVSTCPARGGA